MKALLIALMALLYLLLLALLVGGTLDLLSLPFKRDQIVQDYGEIHYNRQMVLAQVTTDVGAWGLVGAFVLTVIVSRAMKRW